MGEGGAFREFVFGWGRSLGTRSGRGRRCIPRSGSFPARRAYGRSRKQRADTGRSCHFGWAAIVSCLPVLAASGRRGRSSIFAGMLCFAAMLAVTLLGNVPINDRILELAPETGFERFTNLRERWDTLHTARIILDVAGFGFFIAGALSRCGRSRMERT